MSNYPYRLTTQFIKFLNVKPESLAILTTKSWGCLLSTTNISTSLINNINTGKVWKVFYYIYYLNEGVNVNHQCLCSANDELVHTSYGMGPVTMKSSMSLTMSTNPHCTHIDFPDVLSGILVIVFLQIKTTWKIWLSITMVTKHINLRAKDMVWTIYIFIYRKLINIHYYFWVTSYWK